jgi:hypothetical protein
MPRVPASPSLQELSLLPALSVEENLLLAPGKGAWRGAATVAARATLERLGAEVPTPLYRESRRPAIGRDCARHAAKSARSHSRRPTSSLHVRGGLHDIIRGLRAARHRLCHHSSRC